MSKAQEYAAREAELLGDELEIAGRIVEWMDLLEKIREAAGKGADPAQLVEQIKRIDPAMLEGVGIWLRLFVMERFQSQHHDLARKRTKSANASKPRVPIKQDDVQAARAALGAHATQEEIAARLGVDVQTLRARLRAWGSLD
jgi:hypothetical protein